MQTIQENDRTKNILVRGSSSDITVKRFCVLHSVSGSANPREVFENPWENGKLH